MAQPILFNPPVRDTRAELLNRLQQAPTEHLEALLDLYAILQLLRDRGLLELAKGVLGSGEQMLQILTETFETETVVHAVRNLVILFKVLGALEPEVLEKIVRAMNESIEGEGVKGDPPSLWSLLGTLTKAPARRALLPVVAAIHSLGEHIHQVKAVQSDRDKSKHRSSTHSDINH